MSRILQPGTRAPAFTLANGHERRLALSELRGKPVVLAFYPADWNPVCGDQMALYSALIDEFRRLEAQLVGISVDGVWCHAAFAAARRLRFPLLSDFEPKGNVSKQYGVYSEHEGVSERALFILDREGMVNWSYLSVMRVNPGADGLLDALEALAKKEGR
jgi:peroxiredoxin